MKSLLIFILISLLINVIKNKLFERKYDVVKRDLRPTIIKYNNNIIYKNEDLMEYNHSGSKN